MKNKILLVGILVLGLALTGCGNNPSGETKKVIDQGKSGETTNTEKGNKIYSDENRLVFNANGAYYIVIDFGSDGYANSLKWMYEYDDSATAKTMVSVIKANIDENSDVKSVTQDGKYVVVDYNNSVYENLDKSSADAAYSYYTKVNK